MNVQIVIAMTRISASICWLDNMYSSVAYPAFEHRAISLRHQRLDKRLEHLVRCIFVYVHFITQIHSNSV